MIRVLLSLCLTGAAVCDPVTLHIAPTPPGYAQRQHPAAPRSKQSGEVHSVIVDLPQVDSLEFASPDTWYRLPIGSLPD
jgi:hypothetical protein